MSDSPLSERRPPLTPEERAARRIQRAEDAAVAIAEHEEREAAKCANMERLRAERLARDG